MTLALALASVCANAAQSYPMTLQSPPEKSKVTQTYDETTGVYSIHVDENPFGTDSSVLPAVRLSALTEVLPDYAKTLTFEYKASKPSGPVKLSYYNLGTKGQFSNKITEIAEKVDATEEWQIFRTSVTQYQNSVYKFGMVYVEGKPQYIDIIFTQFVTGTDFQIRNIRFEGDELPYTERMLTADGELTIEAEDFNISAIAGKNYSSRQNNYVKSKYISPTPGEFPIYAFTSVDYVQLSNDEGPDMEATAKLMNKKYRDLEAAGFNITEGGAYAGIDRCFLFDGLDDFNGYQANLYDGLTNLKMMIRAGVDDGDVIRQAMKSPRCAGYVIIDEPHVTGFNGCNIATAATKTAKVRAIDDSRMLYGNLLHINTIPGDFGAVSYDDYVKEFMEKTGMGVLSYDYYAVRIMGEDVNNDNPPTEDNCILMPNFFMNMEVMSKLSKYYNVPWWGFTMTQASKRKIAPSSVYLPGDFRYPEQWEESMRVQIFSLLCYGAQGIQYWSYTAHGDVPSGPCNADGTLNPTYYYAKNINKEVKALTWVFLGAELVQVGHTNPVTPDGCARLTADLMPAGVSAVTRSGQGMPVSTLQNGSNLFMMAVNPDLFKNQDITVTLDKAAKRVLPDGTTQDVAAGKQTVTLTPGGYLIYLLDENAPELVDYTSPYPVFDNYRNDADYTPITANPAASNGYYIPGMGSTSWTNYSLITPIDEKRTITREQAAENWGAWYAYSFEVEEDMDVDITIGHSVPWSEYGRVAAVGAKPGVSYTIENEPTLNWPKAYAASMTLELDGETLMPAQTARPVVPEVYDESGVEFNNILADKSRWISTEGDENLYFWPKAGGNNEVETSYNDNPDYRAVKLTAGTHRIVVRSNCYPWNFDAINIATAQQSGIGFIPGQQDVSLSATGTRGGILIDSSADFNVFNIAGVTVAQGSGSEFIQLPAGVYIVAAGSESVKVLVK